LQLHSFIKQTNMLHSKLTSSCDAQPVAQVHKHSLWWPINPVNSVRVTLFLVSHQIWSVQVSACRITRLHVVVMIWVTLVNRKKHRDTAFDWLYYQLSQSS